MVTHGPGQGGGGEKLRSAVGLACDLVLVTSAALMKTRNEHYDHWMQL